ncbi:hypothetical protein CK203_023494 [Vitis vinifera]|uniref:Uncharacterized protein n=1 Tax=Vitis vinifera TaxID=29760 RepID=A0A438J6T7_VITVI|nr:hypothetical protein CK203_023494 [Vitis vinifera]
MEISVLGGGFKQVITRLSPLPSLSSPSSPLPSTTGAKCSHLTSATPPLHKESQIEPTHVSVTPRKRYHSVAYKARQSAILEVQQSSDLGSALAREERLMEGEIVMGSLSMAEAGHGTLQVHICGHFPALPILVATRSAQQHEIPDLRKGSPSCCHIRYGFNASFKSLNQMKLHQLGDMLKVQDLNVILRHFGKLCRAKGENLILSSFPVSSIPGNLPVTVFHSGHLPQPPKLFGRSNRRQKTFTPVTFPATSFSDTARSAWRRSPIFPKAPEPENHPRAGHARFFSGRRLHLTRRRVRACEPLSGDALPPPASPDAD